MGHIPHKHLAPPPISEKQIDDLFKIVLADNDARQIFVGIFGAMQAYTQSRLYERRYAGRLFFHELNELLKLRSNATEERVEAPKIDLSQKDNA